LRFNSCQNRESLLGSLGILGRAGLLQDTVYGDMSQIMTFLSNKCLNRIPRKYDCRQQLENNVNAR
ncbi:MAG: hypothetical protein DRI97_00865, partial [Bacteroidetes bacterium]